MLLKIRPIETDELLRQIGESQETAYVGTIERADHQGAYGS